MNGCGAVQSPMCHVYMCTAASGGWNATWNDDGFSQDTCFKEQTQLSEPVTSVVVSTLLVSFHLLPINTE